MKRYSTATQLTIAALICIGNFAIVPDASARKTRSGNTKKSVKTAVADTALQQSMTIEREFVPIVRDADKINRQPAIEQPKVNKTSVSYANWYAATTGDNTLTRLPVGQVFDDEPFNRNRGYVEANIGNYWNTNIDAGYRIIENENTVFKVTGGYHLTSAELEMVQTDISGEQFPDWKNTHSSGYAAISLQRELEKCSWSADISYSRTKYNLLNYDLFSPAGTLDGILPKIKQTTGDFEASIAFDNHNRNSKIQHYTRLELSDFTLSQPDGSELKARLRTDISTELFDQYTGGLIADITALNYSFTDQDGETYKPLKSGVGITLSPYLFFDFDALQIRAGVRTDFISGPKNHFGIAPDVRATYDLSNHKQQLFADITGGLERKTFRTLMAEIPFYVPTCQYKNPWTIADVTLGYRNYVSGNLRGEIFAGFKYTMDDVIPYVMADEVYGMTTRLDNKNDFCTKVGGKVEYTYSKYLAASARLTAFGHSEKEAASHRPSFETEIRFTSTPIKELQAEIFYCGQYGRHAWIPGNEYYEARKINLKNFSDIGLKGNWKFDKNLQLYARIDNILCQKYDVWAGVPGQRINFHIGGTWQF